MAQAKKNVVVKEVEKVVVTKEEVVTGVTLELTMEEAQALRDFIGYTCAGNPNNKNKKAVMGVHYALNDAGFTKGNGKDIKGWATYL